MMSSGGGSFGAPKFDLPGVPPVTILLTRMLCGAAGCIGSELCQRCADTICRERPVALVVILDRVHQAIIAITQFDPLTIVRQWPSYGPRATTPV